MTTAEEIKDLQGLFKVFSTIFASEERARNFMDSGRNVPVIPEDTYDFILSINASEDSLPDFESSLFSSVGLTREDLQVDILLLCFNSFFPQPFAQSYFSTKMYFVNLIRKLELIKEKMDDAFDYVNGVKYVEYQRDVLTRYNQMVSDGGISATQANKIAELEFLNDKKDLELSKNQMKNHSRVIGISIKFLQSINSTIETYMVGLFHNRELFESGMFFESAIKEFAGYAESMVTNKTRVSFDETEDDENVPVKANQYRRI